MTSCTGASVGSSLCLSHRGLFNEAQCLAGISSRSIQNSAKQKKPNTLCGCIVPRNATNINRRACIDRPSVQIPISYIRKETLSCSATDGNSTSSTGLDSTTKDADSSTTENDQKEGDYVSEYEEEADSIGKALSQIRQERMLSGEDSPSNTQGFWGGVLEEIQLIEWPSLQKVLGTTGVVTSIIIGSSLVLLTVNALLAKLSDAVFKNVPPS
ncbi:hypothetical protein KP509_14G006400 [Ceratopteris richardii]|uniref:Uncharacterized protein n=2 Tax=Ceratopteris richardii TaxID=49495 RepID=A0A8T2T5E2_CERRI|nr:hypothetical protein KP509_14G006400 [Ceratopteris richardii]